LSVKVGRGTIRWPSTTPQPLGTNTGTVSVLSNAQRMNHPLEQKSVSSPVSPVASVKQTVPLIPISASSKGKEKERDKDISRSGQQGGCIPFL
ncbi:hypothetical protein BX616_009307, partial [Lobosporangium transversale]